MEKKTNPVTWFEIPTNDLDRAKKFYEASFGWELNLQEMGPYMMAWFPMDMEALGSTGTLIKGEGFVPSQEGTLVYFTVKSIDDTLALIEKAGGKQLAPKMSIGEHGSVAQFLDSEGNRVALHENTGKNPDC